MVSRTRNEDSDPVLEVSAVGTGGPDGDYVQHEAVAPHKARDVDMTATTVVIRGESNPPPPNTTSRAALGNVDASGAAALHDETSAPEEVTSVTKARLRANGWSVFRLVAFVEAYRWTTLTFVVGVLLVFAAAMLALR